MDAATVPFWMGVCRGETHTAAIARAIAAVTRCGDILALIGELGAGKTCFVRALAEGMGIDPRHISSPTFVLMHEYAGVGDRPALVHIDAYRLADGMDAESIGWEYGGGQWARDAVVVIEWADRLEPQIASDYLHIRFDHVAHDARRITMTGHGQWTGRIARLNRLLKKMGPVTIP